MPRPDDCGTVSDDWGGTDTGSVTIAVATVNDAHVYAYLGVDSVTVTEEDTGATTATLTVTRSGNTPGASTVRCRTVNGTVGADDFTAIAATAGTVPMHRRRTQGNLIDLVLSTVHRRRHHRHRRTAGTAPILNDD